MLFLPVSLFQPELETQSTREIFHGWIVFPVPVEIKKLAEKA